MRWQINFSMQPSAAAVFCVGICLINLRSNTTTTAVGFICTCLEETENTQPEKERWEIRKEEQGKERKGRERTPSSCGISGNIDQ